MNVARTPHLSLPNALRPGAAPALSFACVVLACFAPLDQSLHV